MSSVLTQQSAAEQNSLVQLVDTGQNPAPVLPKENQQQTLPYSPQVDLQIRQQALRIAEICFSTTLHDLNWKSISTAMALLPKQEEFRRSLEAVFEKNPTLAGMTEYLTNEEIDREAASVEPMTINMTPAQAAQFFLEGIHAQAAVAARQAYVDQLPHTD